MIITNLIEYSVWRLLEIACSKMNIYLFVKTRTGIKNVNMHRLYGENDIKYKNQDVININPSKLFLSIDLLRDEYTLLDSCVLDSPHYGLIEAVNTGKSIRKTDYYKRFISGKLDGRHCLRERGPSYFYKRNEKAKYEIEQGNYKPVVIYSWKNRYYICDGKHRAALCAFLKKEVRCIIVSNISDYENTAINKEIYRLMVNDKKYSKHINFFKNGEK